jgi:hypothetical protein
MFSTDGATLNGTTFDSTHYYCIINNGGATPTIAVSNVTASAGVGHRFDVREDSAGSKWYFYIDGNAVCGSPLTTTLPTSALAEMTLVTTLTTAAAQVNLAYMEVWSDK